MNNKCLLSVLISLTIPEPGGLSSETGECQTGRKEKLKTTVPGGVLVTLQFISVEISVHRVWKFLRFLSHSARLLLREIGNTF